MGRLTKQDRRYPMLLGVLSNEDPGQIFWYYGPVNFNGPPVRDVNMVLV